MVERDSLEPELAEHRASSVSDTRIKVCGVTRVEDAVFAVEAGATLIGLNFVPASPRCVSVEVARKLVTAINGRAEVVGVVANLEPTQLLSLRQAAQLDTLQLHGDELPESLEGLSVNDYKAVRISDAKDVELARRYPGHRILVDAKVPGVLGGSGHVFDWHLVAELAKERQLLLAGGLTPDNVGVAVSQVHPWAVDVASGVESAPGLKSPEKVLSFIRRTLGH